jgi:hypothetical protein
MADTFFIICYPCGDPHKLAVAEISYGCEYEMNDYRLASRERFDSEHDANVYAQKLAQRNGLRFMSSGDFHNYLD